ncbi:Hypothetical protein R9X50_00737500 [Acrodontium crateriforme]|uniref:Fungal N-terminal domain-containing protein n=1 Tax=Acrodontium crateriforme TaxID=150365 RepID=A0AAQ3RAQ2_9PEZI|nr:Hypothetical protein R9X50_00737500 [Acrodontium crateriforme]
MSGAEAVVGVAASGAGLASLTIQLFESWKKIKAFMDDVRDAPEALENLVAYLEGIQAILEWLESRREHSGQSLAILDMALEGCCKTLKKLESKLQAIKKGMTGSLKGKIKAALEKSPVTEIVVKLGRDLQALDLALVFYRACCEEREQEQRERDQLLWQGTLVERLRAEFQLASENTAQQIAQMVASIIVSNRGDMTAALSQRARVGTQHLSSRRIINVDDNMHDKSNVSNAAHDMSNELYRGHISKPWFHARVCFPKFITSRVWELAVKQAGSGWDRCLKTYNIVPKNARIFKLCEAGDIRGVDRLVESGKAAFLDLDSSGATLMMRAIFSTEIDDSKKFEMCKYLLTRSDFPDKHGAMLQTLRVLHWRKVYRRIFCRFLIQWFSGDQVGDAEKLVMYKSIFTQPLSKVRGEILGGREDPLDILPFFFGYFINVHGLDIDLEDVACLENWSFEETGAECWNIVVKNQSGPLSLTSKSIILATFIDRGVSARPHELSNIFGLDVFGRQMAKLKDPRGRSALWMVASELEKRVKANYKSSSTLEEWFDLGVRLIRNGADPHGRNHKGEGSIVSGYIWDFHARLNTRVTLVRLWAQLLDAAGVNLVSYGDAEVANCDGGAVFFEYALDGPHTCFLLYGSRPDDWGIRFQPIERLQIFQYYVTPGTFPQTSRVPTKISWYPIGRERLEGAWRLGSEHHRHSLSNTAVDHYKPPENRHIPLADMINSTQDDTLMLPLLLERERHQRPRKRSQSEPRLANDGICLSRGLIVLHQCPLDGKYRIGCVCTTLKFSPDHLQEFKRMKINLDCCVRGDSQDYGTLHSQILVQLLLDSERKNEGRRFRAERSAASALTGLAEKGGWLSERY